MDERMRGAYLERLGLEAEPPSVDALQRLHRRQVERVPYETMWIHAGEQWDIEPASSVDRVARRGRGGYCFHLNGAFSELLRALGYDVTRHVGGVHGPGGPDAAMLSNHLVLTVSGLPTEDNQSGVWYVDVGLGDALHEALPLAAGDYVQGPFTFSLAWVEPGGSDDDSDDDTVGDWHLTHDPAGGFTGMSWRNDRADMNAFTERHCWLSTSPESGFVKVATAQRRDEMGVDVMRGLVLTRVGEGATTHEPLTDRADWFATLADVFDLRFDGVAPGALDTLWERSITSFRAWDAAGRP